MDTNSITPEKPIAPQQTPVVVKEKVKSRPAVVILSVLLLFALVGVGVLGQIAYGQNQALESANEVIAKYSNENADLKNTLAGGGKDLVDESAINRESLDYLRANGMDIDKYVVNIRYIDPDYTFARVIVNERLEKVNGVVGQGVTVHTFVLKSLPNDKQDKSWVIVAVDANSPDEQKAVQAKYGVTADVFTKSIQQ